jgi:hypothetical protein
MKRSILVFNLAGGLIVAACSSSNTGNGFSGDSGTGTDGPITVPTGSGDGSTGMLPTGEGGKLPPGSGSGTSPVITGDGGPCTFHDSTDHDGDGWSGLDGDCNDCNKYINPGAYDIPADGIDEDCDGKVDDEPTGCDSALTSVATTAGTDGAKAMDLCRSTTEGATGATKTWGVIDAEYVLPDGSNSPQTPSGQYLELYGCDPSNPQTNFGLGVGILGPKFGTNNVTQEGQHMLGLSSGTARDPSDTGYQPVWGFDKCYTSGAPAGFPGETPACGSVQFGAPHDGAGLRVVIRVPTNALTMSFDTNFFSYEFPEWVCSKYNDTFVVIMTPTPAGEPTTANDNIAFDSKGNVISVNAGFLAVCDPTTTAGVDGTGTNAGHYSYACSEGPSKLLATGFGSDSPAPPGQGSPKEDHASTDWLTTTVSVSAQAGKEITLLFAVWDSTDGELDTTMLIDNVHWTFATLPNTVPPPPPPPMTLPK